jgi:peptidoglycan/LPS O-acetylase OafA/YrhL
MRLGWVEHIKTVAIVLVVAYHATGRMGLPNYTFGQVGVDLFLIVSGYTLALSLRAESAWAFYRRRLFRILPAYWIAFVIVVATLAWLGATPRIEDLLLHASLLHLYSDRFFFGFMNAWWYVGAIGFFYAIFPLLTRFIREGRVNMLMLIAIALTIAWTVKVAITASVPFWQTAVWTHFVVRIPMFFIGICLAIWQNGNADVRRDAVPLALQVVVLTAVALATAKLHMLMWSQAIGLFYFWMAFVLAHAISRSPIVSRMSLWIAAISYEIYLIHDLFLMKLQGTAVAMLTPYVGSTSVVTAALLSIPVSVLAAIVLRWLAEGAIKALTRPRRTSVKAATASS